VDPTFLIAAAVGSTADRDIISTAGKRASNALFAADVDTAGLDGVTAEFNELAASKLYLVPFGLDETAADSAEGVGITPKPSGANRADGATETPPPDMSRVDCSVEGWA